MPSFAALISTARRADGSLAFDMPDSWRQGRTAYGGLSAAVAYQAARGVDTRLPALRSAQIAFVGPVGTNVQASATILRRGKSSAFVEARVLSDGEPALLATFLFMAGRASAVNLAAPTAPAVPAPETAEPAMRGKGPAYRGHMEFRHAASAQDRGKPELLRWVRLRERDGIDPVSELLLIGDALPAGILPLFEIPPIVSSANWTVNLHGTDLTTQDGWWLVNNRAESAVDGISAQSMQVWNRSGVAAVSASQTVSFFVAAG